MITFSAHKDREHLYAWLSGNGNSLSQEHHVSSCPESPQNHLYAGGASFRPSSTSKRATLIRGVHLELAPPST